MTPLEMLLIGFAVWLTDAMVPGHWMADAAWYSLVSGSFSRGRALMPE